MNPNAITSPGTASGSISNASIAPRPRTLPRTISLAATNPTTVAAAVAHSDSTRLFRMLLTASGWVSASRQPSTVTISGSTVPYHCPGGARLARMVPMCGSPATSATPPTATQHASVPHAPMGRSCLRTLAFACMACARPPTVSLLVTYSSTATVSITATSAYGRRLDSMSFRPSKICTLVTRRYSNMSGVPSSVKLQMNTITAPAKAPGRTSGSVTRRKRVQAPAPRFLAASSSAGSRLDSAAARFRYTMGYSDSVSSSTTAQKPPAPTKSMPCSTRPSFSSSAFSEPSRPSRCRRPIAPTKGGRMSGRSSSPVSIALPRNANRLLTSASGIESSSVPAVTHAAIASAFIRPARLSGSRNTSSTWCAVHPSPSEVRSAPRTISHNGHTSVTSRMAPITASCMRSRPRPCTRRVYERRAQPKLSRISATSPKSTTRFTSMSAAGSSVPKLVNASATSPKSTTPDASTSPSGPKPAGSMAHAA